MSETLDFVHQYVPAAAASHPTLIMLHGTGGDDQSILDLGRVLLPGAALLSPRGKVSEHGMARYFRRLAEGVFDTDDLIRRTHELADFLGVAANHYTLDQQQFIAAGYSNGANIAASILLLRPEALPQAILFHPMVPLVPDELPDLQDRRIFISGGRRDPICPPEQTERLAMMLESAGAAVTLVWQPGGHELTMPEIEAAQRWLQQA